jgi:hypothetical protein
MKLMAIVLLVLIAAGALVGAGAAADELDLKTARTLLQTILGSDFKKEQIQVKNIKSGGLVEAQIETTFRFAREGKEWKIAEVRLGDRHWESIELVEEAIKREKARRTQALLGEIASRIESYRGAHGSYVEADSFDKLLDKLSPQFLNPIVRFDLWGEPLSYEGNQSTYKLASAGPDGKPGTADDIVVESKTATS